MNVIAWKLKNLLTHRLTHGLKSEVADLRKVGMRGITSAKIIKANGQEYDLGIISKQLVVTVGLAAIQAKLAGATTSFNKQRSGTGTTAPAASDTALETPTGANVTSSSVTSAAAVFTAVATINYTTTLAITEHGMFNDTPTLIDRSTFSAINVVNGDAIVFTFNLTAAAV